MALNELSEAPVFRESSRELSQESCEPCGIQDFRSNREYKSTVFTSYFSIPEHAEKLYEGLDQELRLKAHAEIKPEDIVFETLDGVLYMARKNDLAFTVRKKILVIGEHQSSVNENMPLRGAIYYGRTMEKLVPSRAIYRKKRISIPTPEFYIFYNGKEPQPLEQILSLSDSYLEKTDSPMLELKVKVINVNLSAGHPILKKCRPLYEYSWFMWQVREYLENGEDRDAAIRQAMEDCVRQGIMTDYIQKHGSEVRNMLFTEFNLDDAKEVWEEEAREEGRIQGKAEGKEEKLAEQICRKLRKQKNPETIAEELEEELPLVQDICRKAAIFAPDYDVRKVLQALKEA